MHELSIALSLIDGVVGHSDEFAGGRVEAVHIRVGPLSGVDRDALTFSYEAAIVGTELEGSHLRIESTPLVMLCPTCASERTLVSTQRLCCPECQAPAETFVSGKELELTSIEVSA